MTKILPALLSLIEHLDTRTRGLGNSTLRRYLSIASVSLAGTLTLFMLQWALEGSWLTDRGHRVVELSAQFLPVPFAFLAWVHLMERSEKFALAFSPLFAAISIACFTAMYEFTRYQHMATIMIALGIFAGLFVMVPFGTALRRAWQNKRPTIAALIAGSSAYAYYWLIATRGVETITGWTTQAIYTILHGLGTDVSVIPTHNSFILKAPHFSIRVNPGCNGLEGIFLFNFLLSFILLIDWNLFKNRRMLFLYVLGFNYMFLINALRIIAFFMLGYMAYQPSSPTWLQSLQGAPVYLFHSYVGWVFYLIAFGIFASWLYKSANKERLAASG